MKRNKRDLRLDTNRAAQLLESRGMKKKFLAEQMEVEPRTLYRWFSGAIVAPPAMVKFMAVTLGVPVEEIAA